MAATIGSKLGLYEITALIGKGGMGEVYRARDPKLKRDVAIKILPDEFSCDPDRVARFQREAEASSGIAHPNVVDVHDMGITPDGRPFLASEFLEGKDFAGLLDERERIDSGVAVHVVRQVCRALAAAHARRRRSPRPQARERVPDGA